MEWFMLNYTLPKEPSRARVSVWRKLKKYGSVSIGQSMWILPQNEESLDVFREISKEIEENNGTAYIIKAEFMEHLSTEEIKEAFNSARNEEYRELLEKCDDFFDEIKKETQKKNFTFAELEENEDEYIKLEGWLEKIAVRDFFSASLGKKSQDKLKECRRLLEEFSMSVYGSEEKRF